MNENPDKESIKKEEGSKENPMLKMLIAFVLLKNGIDNDGKPVVDFEWDEEYEKDLDIARKFFMFDENIDLLILKEWEEFKINNKTKTRDDFIQTFESELRYYKLEEFVPDFIRERNIKIEKAYNNVLETIRRMQGWFDNEKLRVRIESDKRNDPMNLSTMLMCTTPFCIVTLGCDQIGRYSIVYSLDKRILEMISNDFASTLIRRIYQFTPGALEVFVRIGSLNDDCIKFFEELTLDAKSNSNHRIITVDRFKERNQNELLSELKLKDDISDEERKWFNK